MISSIAESSVQTSRRSSVRAGLQNPGLRWSKHPSVEILDGSEHPSIVGTVSAADSPFTSASRTALAENVSLIRDLKFAPAF